MRIERDETMERLRAASDAILLLVREVDELERHKRGVPPADERFRQLATAVHDAAARLTGFAAEEEAYARLPEVRGETRDTISASHDAVPLREILARWRDVERRLAAAPAGSPEAEALFEEFGRARDEYLRAFRERRR